MDSPIELPDGRLVCKAHRFVVCYECTVDYSCMDEVLNEDKQEESDEDELLTEEEMKAFRERMIVKKGCGCMLPLAGSGCQKCDSKVKDKKQDDKTGESSAAESTKTGQQKQSR